MSTSIATTQPLTPALSVSIDDLAALTAEHNRQSCANIAALFEGVVEKQRADGLLCTRCDTSIATIDGLCAACNDAPPALPTITIMEPRQFHGGAGHFSPMMVQVVCSQSSMSRLFRTKRIAREYVAGLVAAGKAVWA